MLALSYVKPQTQETSHLEYTQAWATVSPPAKRHLNGVSLAGDSGPLLHALYVLWIGNLW